MISRSFQTVPCMRGAWKWETCLPVSVFFVQVGSQISPRRAKKDSNIPSPGRTRSVKCLTPGPTKTIKSPPHALPPPPAGFTLICAWDYRSQSILQKHQKAAERAPGGNPYKGLYGETPHERGNFFQVFKRVGISLVFGLWKGPRANRWKSRENALIWQFIHVLKKVHLQQFTGVQISKLGTWKRYHRSIEGIGKGYLFRQKWYIKG